MKSLGMNMKEIFYSNFQTGRALKESHEQGLTRIEITYTVSDVEGEKQLVADRFVDGAKVNLQNAFLALQSVRGLGWKVPLKTLHENFILHARGHQLLIV